MFLRSSAALAAAVLLSAGSPASAADPVVDAAWVKAHIAQPDIVFVDLRPVAEYEKSHVPGAVHTDFAKDGWRVNKVLDKQTGDKIAGLLPDPASLEKLIGGLGIDNATHVVLLSPGKAAADLGMSTRLYWTFLVLGHKNVSVVNGGMSAYLKDKSDPLETGKVTPRAKTFTAHLDTTYLATAADVSADLANHVPLLDNRPTDQNLGVNKSGVVTRYGTLPGAKSIPALWMTENGGGMLRDAASLRKLYAAAGVPTEGDAVTFCNTGHWASLGWFVNAEILGNKKTKMYDGSMTEWSHLDPATHPMIAKMAVN
ncbi:sulfurtransferase [Acidimangrovimonas pyrenivorans]|uniref:Sulfurtransferase n=1 Tax=Acidimangrovimonas pyrenivorans TaxID=2030798 RepID=A0ABV7AGX5_9RHOB